MSNTKMRAKVQVGAVITVQGGEAEVLHFHGVAKNSAYPADGSDEDNTFAKFSPSINLQLQLANPNLIGKFQPGDTFYLDFSPVEK